MIKSDFKKINPKHCDLNSHQVDLWFISLQTPVSQHLLSHDERQRAERFYFKHHQRRFCNARASLRMIISRYIDIKAQDILFEYTKHGKPYIRHASQIQFNLSHTSEWALIGIGKHHSLGVDIEQYSGRPYQGIAKHLFSQEEQNDLASAKPMHTPWLFFKIWSEKEALMKASGLGLYYPTETFSVSQRNEDQQVFDKKQQRHWKLLSFMPRVAFSAALCCHPAIDNIRYISL